MLKIPGGLGDPPLRSFCLSLISSAPINQIGGRHPRRFRLRLPIAIRRTPPEYYEAEEEPLSRDGNKFGRLFGLGENKHPTHNPGKRSVRVVWDGQTTEVAFDDCSLEVTWGLKTAANPANQPQPQQIYNNLTIIVLSKGYEPSSSAVEKPPEEEPTPFTKLLDSPAPTCSSEIVCPYCRRKVDILPYKRNESERYHSKRAPRRRSDVPISNSNTLIGRSKRLSKKS